MFRLTDLDPELLAGWLEAPPSVEQALEAVALHMGWDAEKEVVRGADPQEGQASFERHALGRDVLDALWLLLRHAGLLDGMRRGELHERVREALQASDLGRWVVGQRVRRWEAKRGIRLLHGSPSEG